MPNTPGTGKSKVSARSVNWGTKLIKRKSFRSKLLNLSIRRSSTKRQIITKVVNSIRLKYVECKLQK